MNRFIDYEPIPFYFLNDDLDREELVLQLDFMKANGIPAFFLHVRDGVETKPWGTERFFDDVRFIVKKAVERGIKVWLYDEDSYPSGQGGGKIVIDRPELAARALKIKKLTNVDKGFVRENLGNAQGLCGYVVRKREGKEIVIKVENCFGPVRARWYRSAWDSSYFYDMKPAFPFKHVRALTTDVNIVFETEAEQGDDVYIVYLTPVENSKYGYAADCLNIETTKEYIGRAHEKYKACVGEYFGKEIPGIFLDEPSAGGVLPYTPSLATNFYEKYGYSIEDNYYRLSDEYVGGEKVRRDYFECAAEMFRKNFIQPIADWCTENGLLCTGHFAGEENPIGMSRGAQNIYRQSACLDIPGFDIIGPNLGNIEYPALLFGAALAVSQAAQQGKKRVLAECFALLPFNTRYRDLKRIGDWLYVLGINFLVPHAFHYAYCAYHRADAGKSFFFQDPYFEDYKKFAAYAGRLGKLLCDYDRKSELLIVYPDGACAECVAQDPSDTLWQRIANCIRQVCDRHVGWDICDTRAAIESAVTDGKCTIGKCTYKKVVVISGGEREEEVYRTLRLRGADCSLFEGDNADCFPDGTDVVGDTKNILIYQKENSQGKIFFLFNNGKEYTEIRLKTGDESVWIYDAEKDETLFPTVKDGFVTLSMQGYRSVVVLLGEKPYTEPVGKYIPEKKKPYENMKPEWVYMPSGARAAITDYSVRAVINGKVKRLKTSPRRLREIFGTQDASVVANVQRPIFDDAPRIENIYPCYAKYTAVLTCADKTDYILFDRHTIEGRGQIFWNGGKVTENDVKPLRVYDASNRAFYPQWKDGKNELKVVFERGEEFDGVSGEFYVMMKK